MIIFGILAGLAIVVILSQSASYQKEEIREHQRIRQLIRKARLRNNYRRCGAG